MSYDMNGGISKVRIDLGYQDFKVGLLACVI